MKTKFEKDKEEGKWENVLYNAQREHFLRGDKNQLALSSEDWDHIIEVVNKMPSKEFNSNSWYNRVQFLKTAANIKSLSPQKARRLPLDKFQLKKWWEQEVTRSLTKDDNMLSRAETFDHGVDIKSLYSEMQPFGGDDYKEAYETLVQLTSGKKVKGVVEGKEMDVAYGLLASIKSLFPKHYAGLDHDFKQQILEKALAKFKKVKEYAVFDNFQMCNLAETLKILSATEVKFGAQGLQVIESTQFEKAPSLPEHKKF